MPCIGRLNNIKMVLLIKLTCIFSTIIIKIPARHFVHTQKLILGLYRKAQNSEHNPREEDNFREMTFPDIKNYYKYQVNKPLMYGKRV